MRPPKTLSLAIGLSALLSLSSCGTKDKAPQVYEMGARVETGHLIYTVFETQWLPQLGTADTARVPKYRFFLIRLSAVNSGSEQLDVPNVTLVDDQGGTVEELPDGDQVPQWIGFVRRAKPAEAVAGNVVFDAPPKHYRLRVSDENGEQPALVDIPLNFNSDIPPAPIPGLSAPGKK